MLFVKKNKKKTLRTTIRFYTDIMGHVVIDVNNRNDIDECSNIPFIFNFLFNRIHVLVQQGHVKISMTIF